MARQKRIKRPRRSKQLQSKRVQKKQGRQQESVNLALQGGGSHGALTWGVLDRLLEEDWLQIDGISGTSAGAMNAAVLAHGYVQGGAQGARDALEGFWSRVSRAPTSKRSTRPANTCARK